MEWWMCGLRFLLAVAIGCAIGAERQWKNRPAGLRTHVLVCVGAAVVAIMEDLMIAETISINNSITASGIAVNFGRISGQVVSGIGFLGAGTIFFSKQKISGLTTAASVWSSACLGLAVGMGYYFTAISGCIIVLITLALLQKLVRRHNVQNITVTFVNRDETVSYIDRYFSEQGFKVLDVEYRMDNKGSEVQFTNQYMLDMNKQTDLTPLIRHFSDNANIRGLETVAG